jgi:hypothetical protein
MTPAAVVHHTTPVRTQRDVMMLACLDVCFSEQRDVCPDLGEVHTCTVVFWKQLGFRDELEARQDKSRCDVFDRVTGGTR